jgi:penicillin-binding protein 2
VKLANVSVASKSGTAQCSDFGKVSNNSWVMSFAPYDNPKYAICIMVQNGQSGGAVCGPLVNLVYRGLFARDMKGIRLPLKPLAKVPGFMGENIKAIEITPEAIAAVEAGDTSPAPEAIAAAAAQVAATPPTVEETEAGETGAEIGDEIPATPPPDTTTVMPTPTITPEVDAEGSVIPKAVPVPEN